MINVEHNGSTYQFTRDTNGVGGWVCIKGRPEGLIGCVSHNVIVPAVVQQELYRKAREQGVSPEVISRTVSVERKKEKAVSVGRKRRAKSNKPRGISLGGD